MEIPSDQCLLTQVEQFLAETGMKPSRLGLDALGDGAVVFQLRDKRRSLTLKSAQRLLNFMARHRAEASKRSNMLNKRAAA